ncbi:hypothetical protein AB0C98_42205 [Streptomyces sp. NPDC048558]|uniref:hypothetical protein n=1 Tax=Streptomyces sp. NPDC048558 TaxID=3155759 RepID=UPI003421F1EF
MFAEGCGVLGCGPGWFGVFGVLPAGWWGGLLGVVPGFGWFGVPGVPCVAGLLVGPGWVDECGLLLGVEARSGPVPVEVGGVDAGVLAEGDVVLRGVDCAGF